MKFYYIFLLAIIFGCTEKEGGEQFVQAIYVPIDQIPKLSEFVSEIEYYTLPNEISTGFFNKIIETEEFFIFADYEMARKIYVLDKAFKLISVISNYGEGPGEYQMIRGINFNQQRQTIEVLSHKYLIRFSITGEYIQSIKVPFDFGNLVSISENKYLVYSADFSRGFLDNSPFLVFWDSKSNQVESIIDHQKNEMVLSTTDFNNIFRYKEEVYATHVYLDTVYIINTKGELSRILINLSNQNVPLEYLKNEMEDLETSVWDNESFREKYAFHYPGLLVTENYLIDKFIKRNKINFFIWNKRSDKVISGRDVVNDIDNGVQYLIPRFVDSDDHLYTFHQTEELLQIAGIHNKKSVFTEYMENIDPESGFVVMRYKLKDF